MNRRQTEFEHCVAQEWNQEDADMRIALLHASPGSYWARMLGNLNHGFDVKRMEWQWKSAS